jgi:hypothetical protein
MAGLLKTKRSKFLTATFLTSTITYITMRHLRENDPQKYRSLIWDPILLKVYPFLLNLTVIRRAMTKRSIEL